jgi:hypothetical protein
MVLAFCAARAEATSPVAAMAEGHKLLGKFGQFSVDSFGPPSLDADVITFDEPCFRQPLAKRICIEAVAIGRGAVQKADEGQVRRRHWTTEQKLQIIEDSLFLDYNENHPPFWAQNALPKGVHASSITIALCPVKRGQLHPDCGVYCGQWSIGRIYETRTGPADLRWFWALHASGGGETLRSSIHAATLEIAKTEFEASWKLWKAWAGMEETSG